MGRIDRVADRAWSVCGASVLGAAHARRSVENQDAYRCVARPDAPVAVVADGHGAAPHMRSAEGARLAADLLADELSFAGHADDSEAVLRDLADSADRFIERWQTAVRAAAAAEPFTAEEQDLLDTEAANYTPEQLTMRAYGTTVLGVHIADDWIRAVAIGDGELGCVDADGTDRALCPLPGSIGVQTDSLAADDPRTVLRTDAVPADGVIAVWACTDGFSTAQSDPEWRSLVARQLRDMLATRTPDEISAQLDGWLAPAAAVGDDTTMVLVLLDGARDEGRRTDQDPAFWRRL